MIRIAIAEDHNALIDGIKVFIEYLDEIMLTGHANNGRDLLDLVERKRPDVVVTDIKMPIMDGIQATRLIRKKHPDTRVIAFTMYENRQLNR